MRMWDSNAPARFANTIGSMDPVRPIFLGDSPARPSFTSRRMDLSDTWIPVSSKTTSLTFLAEMPIQVAVLRADERSICNFFCEFFVVIFGWMFF